MKRKIVLTYKKNGTFNQAVLTIDKKSLNILNLKQDEMVVYLSYLNNEIILKKTAYKLKICKQFFILLILKYLLI